MDATWVGVYTRKGKTKRSVVVFKNTDRLAITYTIRVMGEVMVQNGWFLESYELTGSMENEPNTSN